MSELHPDVRAILEAAIQAPSGENVQPWRFHIEKDQIELHHVDVDSEIYDTGNRGSYIAHGAAIENMVIFASSIGYTPSVHLFPNPALRSQVATVVLGNKAEGISNDTELRQAIFKRVTNRNSYSSLLSNETFLKEYENEVTASKEITCVRITDRKTIEELARVGSTNEEVMLQNETLHSFFFNHVTWTKAEDQEKRVGFYIKTLGLPAPGQLLFKLFKNWWLMRIFRGVGLPSLIAKQNASTYAASAEINILCIPSDSPQHFINAGRMLQRLWLIATKAGVSIQPLAGTLFMRFYLAENSDSNTVFSQKERTVVEKAVKKVEEIADVEATQRTIAFMFRMGIGKPPEAHASRFALEHFLI